MLIATNTTSLLTVQVETRELFPKTLASVTDRWRNALCVSELATQK